MDKKWVSVFTAMTGVLIATVLFTSVISISSVIPLDTEPSKIVTQENRHVVITEWQSREKQSVVSTTYKQIDTKTTVIVNHVSEKSTVYIGDERRIEVADKNYFSDVRSNASELDTVNKISAGQAGELAITNKSELVPNISITATSKPKDEVLIDKDTQLELSHITVFDGNIAFVYKDTDVSNYFPTTVVTTSVIQPIGEDTYYRYEKINTVNTTNVRVTNMRQVQQSQRSPGDVFQKRTSYTPQSLQLTETPDTSKYDVNTQWNIEPTRGRITDDVNSGTMSIFESVTYYDTSSGKVFINVNAGTVPSRGFMNLVVTYGEQNKTQTKRIDERGIKDQRQPYVFSLPCDNKNCSYTNLSFSIITVYDGHKNEYINDVPIQNRPLQHRMLRFTVGSPQGSLLVEQEYIENHTLSQYDK